MSGGDSSIESKFDGLTGSCTVGAVSSGWQIGLLAGIGTGWLAGRTSDDWLGDLSEVSPNEDVFSRVYRYLLESQKGHSRYGDTLYFFGVFWIYHALSSAASVGYASSLCLLISN